MVSISGIRGIFGDGLDAEVIVRYAGAFGTWCKSRAERVDRAPLVIVGRDARVTGPLCADLVRATLQSVGCDVIDVGLATTPTVEMGVLMENAVGGVILSASHNPAEWNALKLLGDAGEFLRASEAQEMLQLAERDEILTVAYSKIGSSIKKDYLPAHIDAILDLPFINAKTIEKRAFKVVVDGINSVGAVALPALLQRLGVNKNDIIVLNGEPTGLFAHNPEPLPDHLKDTIKAVASAGADLGLVVDPDADRLALVADGGVYVSEELTQVLAADFLWSKKKGAFVTNLSSSRAIEDVAGRYGMSVYRSAVGEINVVDKMKEVEAVLGGEGNGGVILPELHYGRDALVGTAMILQHLAAEEISLSAWRDQMPVYHMSKGKIPLDGLNPDEILVQLAHKFKNERHSTIDGLKIDFDDGWVHLRKSNTEPILRVYSEAQSPEEATTLADRFRAEISERT